MKSIPNYSKKMLFLCLSLMIGSGTIAYGVSAAIKASSSSGSDPDFRTLDRIAPTATQGWDIDTPSSQTFSNWRGSDIDVTFTYSDNMWDGNPNIYTDPTDTGVPGWTGETDNHCSPFYNGTLRWTNNRGDNVSDPPGAPGSATGTALLRIDFSEPVHLQNFEVGSLSNINYSGTGSGRTEWILVRAYDASDALLAVDNISSSDVLCPDSTLTDPPDAVYGETSPGSLQYYAYGVAVQTGDDTTNAYNHASFTYNTDGVSYIEIEHWASPGFVTAFNSAYNNHSNGLTSITFNTFALSPATPHDWGDLPDEDVGVNSDNFPTTNSDGGEGIGASHQLGSPVYLGNCVDADTDGQSSITDSANHDNLTGTAGDAFGTCATEGEDEDGIVFNTPLVSNTEACVDISVTTVEAANAVVNGWIDFNDNGVLDDAGEQVFTNLDVDAGAGVGTYTHCFVAPSGLTPETTLYSRWRINDDGLTLGNIGPLAPTGPADNGEVEDYVLEVSAPTAVSLQDSGVENVSMSSTILMRLIAILATLFITGIGIFMRFRQQH